MPVHLVLATADSEFSSDQEKIRQQRAQADESHGKTSKHKVRRRKRSGRRK